MSEWAVGSTVRPATHGDGEVRIGGMTIGEMCGVRLKTGSPSLRDVEPDIVNRLIRMVEELLERDDLTPDADPTWYRNRLREIKEEVARGEAPVPIQEPGKGTDQGREETSGEGSPAGTD